MLSLIFSLIFLVAICILILLYILTLFLLFKRNKKKAAYSMLIIPLFLIMGLVVRENWAYNIHIKTADRIRAELKVGMSVEQIPYFLENNQERLHIYGWVRQEDNNNIWFTVSLDTPFSFKAFCKGEGALAIVLDEANKKIKLIHWFM